MCIQLTTNQINRIKEQCINGKHWTEKKDHCIKIIKPFYPEISENNMGWFLSVFIPSEENRLRVKYFTDSQQGIINTKFTPTDVDGSFVEVETPTIGRKYHLSWAFKGAVFQLVGKDEDGVHGYVNNPKHKKKTPLKIKISDLRKLRLA